MKQQEHLESSRVTKSLSLISEKVYGFLDENIKRVKFLLSITKKEPQIEDPSLRYIQLRGELEKFFNGSSGITSLNEEVEKVLNNNQLKEESLQQLSDFINRSNLKGNLKRELENISKGELNINSLVTLIIVDIRENKGVYNELLKILKNIDIEIIDRLLVIFSSENGMDEYDNNEIEGEDDYNVYAMLNSIRYN
ncbi:MAG: hypothetical protein WC850_04040 [Candidatus Gracilibacteria bacterium]